VPQVRSHGKPGQVGEPGAPVQFPLAFLGRQQGPSLQEGGVVLKHEEPHGLSRSLVSGGKDLYNLRVSTFRS
jgi:hypothetical protein